MSRDPRDMPATMQAPAAEAPVVQASAVQASAVQAPAVRVPAVQAPVVARIPYLNAEPFYALWDRVPGTSVDLAPRVLGERARRGQADAGLVATADWFSLPELERVGPLGIACQGAVRSVFLFSRAPLETLAGNTVELTEESSTSAALVRLLLERRYGLARLRYVRRRFEPGSAGGSDAWLLIGDAALVARQRSDRGVVVTDLGQAWFDWTGLPFVYAVWAIRAALPQDEKDRFRAFLEASLAEGERRIESIARAAAGRGLGSESELVEYLRGFRYRLGGEDERGLAKFRRLCQESPKGAVD